jgi:phenylalanyl-tRNA synthetase beta chain
MNVSYRWLLSLLPGYTETPDQVAERLARYGAPPEAVRRIGAQLGDVVIGRVIEAKRHPNADRLSLCTVDAGAAEPFSVVCGAPNVAAGAYYPFAPVGATLPGGVAIRKAKIRGQESRGMLCSARELGLGREHEGILELRGEFEPGASFVRAVGLEDDVVLTLDITPNRPDLLAHYGVARELAPDANVRVALPAIPGSRGEPPLALEHGSRSSAADGVRVTIEDTAACPRYFGAVIRGVTVAPSPAWLDARLRAIGVRPINNVVDATNYVLHELGQPLHAFDLARLGDSVIVRRAGEGEAIRTLDGVDRKLPEGVLVIADATKPVALAGVMGGEATEVTAATRDVFLECALFDPVVVRATRRAVELSTDASYRFERGVDGDGVERALRRCVDLIAALAGGTPARSGIAAGPALPASRTVRIRPKRVAQVLGIELSVERIGTLLNGIGFSAERAADGLTVTVPGFRSRDVLREDDLVEEVARRHGYDEIPDAPRPYRPGTVPDDPLFAVEDAVRERMVGLGFLEARTAAFASEDEGDIALLLPLAATESRLRNGLLHGLVHRLEHNFARGQRDVRLFEIGTVFRASPDGGAPLERSHVAAILTGHRRPLHWSGASADYDIWDAAGMAEDLAALLGCSLQAADATERPLAGAGLVFIDAAHGDAIIGRAARIDADAIDAPAWAAPVFGIEVELQASLAPPLRIAPLPAFPAVDRDLALVVPHDVPAADVGATIRAAGGKWLERVAIFDMFAGTGIARGARSIGYRLRFRAADRTLTDVEVDAQLERVLTRLKEDHGIERRG